MYFGQHFQYIFQHWQWFPTTNNQSLIWKVLQNISEKLLRHCVVMFSIHKLTHNRHRHVCLRVFYKMVAWNKYFNMSKIISNLVIHLPVAGFLKNSSSKYFFWKFICVMRCAIWYDLYNLKNMNNTHGCFSRFLNCTNSAKSHNAPHVKVSGADSFLDLRHYWEVDFGPGVFLWIFLKKEQLFLEHLWKDAFGYCKMA